MSDPAKIQEWMDRLEIQNLAIRYCDATTRGDWQALEEMWMPDGTWEEHAPFNERYVGRDQILSRVRAMLNAMDFFVQVCYGVVVDEIKGDRARAHATIQGIARGGFGSNVNYVIFKDTLVKSGGVWRYADRDLHNIFNDTTPIAATRQSTREQLAALCSP